MFNSPISYIGCNPCEYFCSIGTSVSRWCSDRSHPCNFENCQNFDCCCNTRQFAFLTQTDAYALPAGAPVPFTGTAVIGEGFEFVNGALRIENPGLYRLSYSLNIPSGSTVTSTFVIQANGVNVPGTQQSVSHTSGSPAVTVNAQAFIEVTEPVTLTLISTSAVAITPGVSGDTLASLMIESYSSIVEVKSIIKGIRHIRANPLSLAIRRPRLPVHHPCRFHPVPLPPPDPGSG